MEGTSKSALAARTSPQQTGFKLHTFRTFSIF